jgi:oligoribonuclease (3'-5' exoribonuclease)
MNQTFNINIEETNKMIPECNIIWKVGHKLNISPNYYDLSIQDRETLLTKMNDWIIKEHNTINKIKTN